MTGIERIIKYLNSKELFYVFTGEFSMMLYGIRKFAENYELLVNLTSEDLELFMRFLRYERHVPERMGEDKIVFRTASGGNLVLWKVKDDMDMRTIGRRTSVTYHYVNVYIASPEDIIISHLKKKNYNDDDVFQLYRRWLNYMDMSYLITFAKAENVYKKFIKFKKRAERIR